MKAVTAQQMRELDNFAIDTVAIPGLVLMENAGRGAFELLKDRLEEEAFERVLVMCGGGNNGGDGYVVARHLANHGFAVLVVATRPGADLRGDAHVNWQAAQNMGIPMLVLKQGMDVAEELERAGPFDTVVDSLLGTGASKELEGWYFDLVQYANTGPFYRFAIDIPTGVHADTGRILGDAFQAHDTATFGLPKIGLYLYPGHPCAGNIHIVDISIPAERLAAAEGVDLLGSADSVPRLPERSAEAHKNRMGHLLVVAGSPGKAGAALLAGRAGLRTGAGLCTVATHAGVSGHLEGRVPDLMVEGLDMDGSPAADLVPVAEGKSCIAIGPGLGTGPEAARLVESVFAMDDMPVVADADAISIFAGRHQDMNRKFKETVLTPHPGEMARLLGIGTEEVQADRLGVAAKAAAQTGAVVVLKGPHSVVAHPDGRTVLNLSGSSALAKAGSGDVLTGIIGALLAMGMDAWGASRLGVYLHGVSGDLVAEEVGEHSLLASDLIDFIPLAIGSCP